MKEYEVKFTIKQKMYLKAKSKKKAEEMVKDLLLNLKYFELREKEVKVHGKRIDWRKKV